MVPSVDVAKVFEITAGYLLGETDKSDLFKDPKMLKRFQDISNLSQKEKDSLLLTIDNFVKGAKINLM